MKMRFAFLLFGAAFFVQTLLNSWLPGKLLVDLDLTILIALGICYDEEELHKPLIAAFVFAVISDICFNQHVGVTGVALVLTVLFLLAMRHLVNTENLIFDAGIAAAAVLLYNTIYWFIYYLMGAPYSFLYMLKRLPLEWVFDTAIAFAIMFVMVNRVINARRDRYFR
ncbi:MAG: hypothetical protein IIY84_03880 [Eubacterium sp.]|nr:hypothetical protein [Eubacterium sp.]